MENKKEKTAPNVSVGADTEQPIQKIAENSISEYEKNIKSFEEMQREMQLSLDPSYLKAVSMNELFDTQYQLSLIHIYQDNRQVHATIHVPANLPRAFS